MPYDRLLGDAADYARNYLSTVCERPVAPTAEAIAGLNRFDEALPADPRDGAETLKLLQEAGSPATVATQGSRYFGLVVGGALPVTVGAQYLATAWDQLALSNATSPIAIKLEQVVTSWALDLLDLPRDSAIGFVTGTTMGHLSCLAAARGALLQRMNYDLRRDGLRNAPNIRVVVSEEIHVTALKVLTLLGFGDREVERVPVDRQGRMIAGAMPALGPDTIVCCQVGNVNSGAFDPVGEISELAAKAGAWVHVDGAFGLWARASRSFDTLTAGIEHADSWVTDTHKWLNTPYECGLAICRHPNAMKASLSTDAAYADWDKQAAPKDMVPEFSRRARGIEVWAALRTLGRSGVADLVERCCRHARAFREGLDALGFEILNDVVINQVVAKFGTAGQTQALVDHAQRSGECWFGPTKWQGQQAFRISVSSWRTQDEDVARTLRAIRAARDAVLAGD